MTEAFTFKELAEHILSETKRPMSPTEIWEEAKKRKEEDERIAKKVDSCKGQTPDATIRSYITQDINRNESGTKFCKIRRGLYGLVELANTSEYEAAANETNEEDEDEERNTTSVETREEKERKEDEGKTKERDLHPLLTSFVLGNDDFQAYTKTINHLKCTENGKITGGANQWVYPDIVGVHFPFAGSGRYDKDTVELISKLEDTAITLYSFEMKIIVTRGTLRKYFFQAVSNSSWANEGYLVALKYDAKDMAELFNEMRILNNAFGIGFIELDSENVAQSKILFPAKYNLKIDWNIVNKLTVQNDDFRKFINSVLDDINSSEVHTNRYDEDYDEKRMAEYIKEKGIDKDKYCT